MRLENMCIKAEHCTAEVREKLRQWGVHPDDAAEIIEALIARRFVDDKRFAAAFVRDKYRFARWGRRKIEMALRQKRISDAIINQAFEEIDNEEYTRILTELLAAKAKTLGPLTDYENRVKLFRFALSRGFESSLVSNIIKALAAPEL